MTGFEPQISGIENDRFATTTTNIVNDPYLHIRSLNSNATAI